MNCSTPGFSVHYQLLELTWTHVHWVSDAIQPSHLLSLPSLPAFNVLQHQGLFQQVSSSHQVARVLELQLQYQSFQWIFRVDFDFQVILTMSSEGKSRWPGTVSPSRARCWSNMGLWQCGVQGLGDFLMNQELTSSEVWLPSWHSCWLVGTQRCVYLSESIPANNRLTLIGWLTKVYSGK